MVSGLGNLLPQIRSPWGETRIHVDSPNAVESIGRLLFHFGKSRVRSSDQILLLCIGTDRSIGDALGPLIGSHLAEQSLMGVTVMGTVDEPVHAGNLVQTLDKIESSFRQPFIVAVDACLGKSESIGLLTVGTGSLRPGAGVNKSLPAVGDLHLTGVVNVGGFMEYFVLQNTRLSLVMRMARIAAAGLEQGLQALLLNGPE